MDEVQPTVAVYVRSNAVAVGEADHGSKRARRREPGGEIRRVFPLEGLLVEPPVIDREWRFVRQEVGEEQLVALRRPAQVRLHIGQRREVLGLKTWRLVINHRP